MRKFRKSFNFLNWCDDYGGNFIFVAFLACVGVYFSDDLGVRWYTPLTILPPLYLYYVIKDMVDTLLYRNRRYVGSQYNSVEDYVMSREHDVYQAQSAEMRGDGIEADYYRSKIRNRSL